MDSVMIRHDAMQDVFSDDDESVKCKGKYLSILQFVYLTIHIFKIVSKAESEPFQIKTRPEVYSCARVPTLPLSESIIPEIAKI